MTGAWGPWWSGSGIRLLETPDAIIVSALSHRAIVDHRVNQTQQRHAWQQKLPFLRRTLSRLDDPGAWQVLLGFEIPRLGGRIDTVLVSPRAVFVLEFNADSDRFETGAKTRLYDYAVDLQDFHAGSRCHPILPILIATNAIRAQATITLMVPGTAPIMEANATSLPDLIADLNALPAVTSAVLDVPGWASAAYRPVPNVIEAACRLFQRHHVADIVTARADTQNLSLTAKRIDTLLSTHSAAGTKLIAFVTGIPGAGKTLCGLNAAFSDVGETLRATFLTGNPSLVHVLREALVRSVATTPAERRTAAHRMEGVIQALPKFRDHGVASGQIPAERVLVIDEAQRCWTAAHAISRTRDRPVRLDRSEPAHLLDIMARHDGFAAILCLIGHGQEIHDGEGGLATWSQAIADRPEWHVAASATTQNDPVPRNRLGALPHVTIEPSLHLDVPVRALRHPATPRWVDCVLRGDPEAARAIVSENGVVPFRLTRDLHALRAGLKHRARNVHRAGLVASAGARRLRAEGLGCELPHMDADAVARWFLDSWTRDRDVRASDALELVATQFSVQGLELDQVGLCWDSDLIRAGPGTGWQVRSFRGTRWQTARDPDKIAWRINTYRVLLTRARYETLIWVPRGDAEDTTRDPAVLDRIADFLGACGVLPL